MSWSAPSASAMQLPRQVGADRGDGGGELGRAGRRRRTRRRPAAAPCRWSTCSRRSRAGRRSRRVADAQRRVAARPASTTASVVSTTSIVASAGREHAGALGHAADGPAVAAATTAFLGTRVGRHDRAAPRRRRRRRRERRRPRSTPASSLSIGSRSPISPVEQTATSPARDAEQPRRPCSAVAWVSWKPSGPVQALAPPELSTTRATPPSATHLLGPEHRARP